MYYMQKNMSAKLLNINFIKGREFLATHCSNKIRLRYVEKKNVFYLELIKNKRNSGYTVFIYTQPRVHPVKVRMLNPMHNVECVLCSRSTFVGQTDDGPTTRWLSYSPTYRGC